MKQFIVMMRRHGLPMIASATSASVLTWMICDLEHSKQRLRQSVLVDKAAEKKDEHEWHGN